MKDKKRYRLYYYYAANECEGRPHITEFGLYYGDSGQQVIDNYISEHYPHEIAHGKNKKAKERDLTKAFLRAERIYSQDYIDSLNKKIEELETCRKCLRVKNCEVCTHNTLDRQDCYSDNFVLDNEKSKNYLVKENKTK